MGANVQAATADAAATFLIGMFKGSDPIGLTGGGLPGNRVDLQVTAIPVTCGWTMPSRCCNERWRSGKKLFQPPHVELTSNLHSRAALAFMGGDYDQAESLGRQALHPAPIP